MTDPSSPSPSPSPFPELLPSNTPSGIHAPIPTPAYGPGGSFSAAFSTTISAPPAACMTSLLNTATWPQWNTFCPRVTSTSFPSPPPALPEGLSGLEAAVDAKEALVPGALVSFEVHMDLDERASNNQSMFVTRLERIEDSDFGAGGRKGFRVAWKSEGVPGFLLRTERVQEFVESGDGCEYFCWDTFYGWVAPVVRYGLGKKLGAGFGAWMEGLKRFAEERERLSVVTE